MSHPNNKDFEIGMYFALTEDPILDIEGNPLKTHWKGTWQSAQDIAEDWAKDNDDAISYITWEPMHYGSCYDEEGNLLTICIYIDEI